jgi:RNA polymerase sigma factor (sigma-70 family)
LSRGSLGHGDGLCADSVQRSGGQRHGCDVRDADVYTALRGDLMRYATALVGVSDAADVVSAVVTRTLERKGGLIDLRDPKPYLMRAILNEARMWHRSNSRKRRAVMSLVGEHASPEHDHVLDVVMELPERQRAAVFLAYYEQYTPTEIAVLMGCRPATVRRYPHLARRKLKVVLDE